MPGLLRMLRRLLGRHPRPDGGRGEPVLRPFLDEIATAWPFTAAAVDVSPALPGVYLLYRSGRLVYIGLAVAGSGIREELASHLRGARGECTRAATAFLYQPAADALHAHGRYLTAHRARYGGRLPPCNEHELAAR